jgi:hypothetical protein
MYNFKKTTLTLMLLLATMAANAETRYRAYCEMIYSAITQQTIIIIEGESRNIKDQNGQPLKFKTMEMALNYLSKNGWHVEPVELPSAANKAQSGNKSTTTILLLSRDNSSEEEIKNMFK